MWKKRKKTNGRVEKKRTRKKCACRKREKGKHAHGKKERKPCMAVEKEKKGTQNNLETGCCATNTGQIIQEKIY